LDIAAVLILFATGLAAGFLGGFLGIGGGVIVIPSLMYYLSGKISTENLFLAVSTFSICTVLVTAGSSAYRHIKAGNYYRESIFPLAAGALFGPIPGNYICSLVNDRSRIIIFTVILVVLSLRVIFQKENKSGDDPSFNKYMMFLTGMFMGIVTAMTGIGGGAVLVPVLVVMLKFNIKKAVGVTSIIMIFNAISFLIGRAFIGGFKDVPLKYSVMILVFISAGTLLTTGIGVKLHLASKEKYYRFIAGTVYITVSVLMLGKVF